MHDLLKTKESLASLIDSTLLSPTATVAEIERLCFDAKKYGFKSVCVHSSMIPTVYQKLKNSNVDITAVVGFPFGLMDTKSKIFEAVNAIKNGADEIDTVVNTIWVKSGEWTKVEKDLHDFANEVKKVKTLKGNSPIIKVIYETAILDKKEKIGITQILKRSDIDFAKTCTGFQGGEATVEDIQIMLSYKAPAVKASGGIRTLDKLEELVEAGATRIGTSSAVNIMKEYISGVRAVDEGKGY